MAYKQHHIEFKSPEFGGNRLKAMSIYIDEYNPESKYFSVWGNNGKTRGKLLRKDLMTEYKVMDYATGEIIESK